MTHYVYILKSQKSNRLYKGITDNLDRRLEQHTRGQVLGTRNFLPISLVYFEELPDRESARKKEKYFKSGSGREFLKKLLQSSIEC